MHVLYHKKYGVGKLKKKKFGSFILYAEFKDGISRWVRSDEVKLLPEDTNFEKDIDIVIAQLSSDKKTGKESLDSVLSDEDNKLGEASLSSDLINKRQVHPKVLSDKQFKARKIIEALRLGIVPYSCTEEFTFGRDKEIDCVKNWLKAEDGALMVSGEYGVGKTHFLEYCYNWALKNNWAVSMVELEPNGLTFNRPKSLYGKIIRSFRFKNRSNEIGDFREFMREVSKNDESDILYGHDYLAKVVENLKTDREPEGLWNWIEGEDFLRIDRTFPPMYSYATSSNIYSYILSGIGWATKNVQGLNGFLILCDEVETLDSLWYTSYQYDKSWNFLRGLLLMSNNDSDLFDDFTRNKAPIWGEKTGLSYCRYPVPYLWQVKCNTKFLFAMTPISSILENDIMNCLEKIELESIDTTSLNEITGKIGEFYRDAYDFQSKKNLLDKLDSNKGTRIYLKGFVELLDLDRVYFNKSVVK